MNVAKLQARQLGLALFLIFATSIEFADSFSVQYNKCNVIFGISSVLHGSQTKSYRAVFSRSLVEVSSRNGEENDPDGALDTDNHPLVGNHDRNDHFVTNQPKEESIGESTSPIEIFVNTLIDSKRHLIAAAVARGTSMCIMYPLDTIKTRIQMGQADAIRLDGIFGGVLGSLFGQIPYGVLTFGSYEIYKSILLQQTKTIFNLREGTDGSSKVKTTPAIVILVYAIAALGGDLTGSVWLCPSEVVKQQVQAGMYDSTWDAIESIWLTKGVSGFYTGYLSAISRDVPFRMFQLTTFEVAKNLALQWKEERAEDGTEGLELSSLEAAICGAAAGTLAAALTSPLDRIKTLLMTNGDIYGGSVVACASQIVHDEGWQGLLIQGMLPRVTYIAPTVMIFFVVYEFMQQQLLKQEQESNRGG